MEQKKQIRFIDSHYNELFRIPDGGKIEIQYDTGEKNIRECKYIDEYHTKIGSTVFHICEFAEVMERNNATYKPIDVLTMDNIKQNNEKLILANSESLKKDKFFFTENGVTEIYYNPDATAGGQVVINEISKELIKEAAIHNKDADDFFAYIDGGCKQFLVDIDTPAFFEFVNKKADFEGINDKTMKGLKKYAGIDKKKSEPER